MEILKGANLGLALLIEVLMLAAFFYWGLSLPLTGPLSWLAAIAAVAIAIILWAVWGAPRSSRRLAMPALLVFKIVMFGLGTLALWAAGAMPLALGFALICLINLGLAGLWRQV